MCEKNIYNDFLFLEEDYLLRVKREYLSLFSIKDLKGYGAPINIRYGDNKRKWAVFKDNSGLNIIYSNKLYRFKEKKIEFITDMNYKNKYDSFVDIKSSSSSLSSYIW